jgi:hypothetical protein
MTHTFTDRQKRTWTLRKAPSTEARAKRGEVTAEALARHPWYIRIRVGGRLRWICLATHDPAEAVRRAKVRLETRDANADQFAALLDQTQRRATTTLGQLATRWQAAGYADPAGRPRTPAQQARQRTLLEAALPWWAERSVASITPGTRAAYADHRRAQVAQRATSHPTHTGDRAVDLELTTLSNLCRWALEREHIRTNPFAGRLRLRAPEAVRHSHHDMPASDDELHLIARTLIELGQPVIAAQVLLQALTGLRPGEPGALRVDGIPHGHSYPPGHVYSLTADGIETQRLAVAREKGGINPAVHIHPTLRAFLDAWLPYRAQHWPCSPWWFPALHDPAQPMAQLGKSAASPFSRWFAVAVEQLRLPRRRPHALRAYYVRVRRSQGIDDARIGSELGERTGATLIVRTYGAPDAIVGDGRFDWLPSDGTAPAWDWYRQQTAASNIVTPTFRQAAG